MLLEVVGVNETGPDSSRTGYSVFSIGTGTPYFLFRTSSYGRTLRGDPSKSSSEIKEPKEIASVLVVSDSMTVTKRFLDGYTLDPTRISILLGVTYIKHWNFTRLRLT